MLQAGNQAIKFECRQRPPIQQGLSGQFQAITGQETQFGKQFIERQGGGQDTLEQQLQGAPHTRQQLKLAGRRLCGDPLHHRPQFQQLRGIIRLTSQLRDHALDVRYLLDEMRGKCRKCRLWRHYFT